jgi:hypothetical protein
MSVDASYQKARVTMTQHIFRPTAGRRYFGTASVDQTPVTIVIDQTLDGASADRENLPRRRRWQSILATTVVILLSLGVLAACDETANGTDATDDTLVAETPAAAAATPTPETEAVADDDASEAEVEAAETPETELTPTPEPEPTPKPDEPAPETEPAESEVQFGEGTFIVGEDIEPGLYAANSPGSGCYWERLSGFSGELGDVNANYFGGNRQVVMIYDTDAGFRNQGCGTWTKDPDPIREDPSEPFGAGTMIVPIDVQPGTWRSEGGDSSCYWARLSDFSGEISGIVTNSFGSTGDVVQISDNDAGFQSSNCGDWVRIGD